MANPDITALELRELLSYDPETGAFRFQASKCAAHPVGAVAGWQAASGYRKHEIRRRVYAAHRLAWLHVHGSWPNGDIDHINGCRSDNRIENLRVVSVGVNNQNIRGARANSKTGLLGVDERKGRKTKRFRAKISLGREVLHIGYFDTAQQAHEAYLAKKREMHPGCSI